MDIDIADPVVLVLAGILFLGIIYLWNKSNRRKLRERRNRNFRDSYYRKKKERKEFEE